MKPFPQWVTRNTSNTYLSCIDTLKIKFIMYNFYLSCAGPTPAYPGFRIQFPGVRRRAPLMSPVTDDSDFSEEEFDSN